MIWLLHIFAIGFIYLSTRKMKQKFFIIASFIYVAFVFGQRWMVGVDFPYYLNYYLTGFVRSEIGYFGIQELFRNANLYFGLLVMFMLVLSLLNNYRFLLKFDNKVMFLLVVYLISELFFGQMTQIRQFIAVSFFINSYFFAYEKNFKRTILNIIGALSFHLSAIFMSVFLFFKPEVNRNRILLVLGLALFFPLINITPIFNLPVFNLYSHYLETDFNVSLGIFHYIKYYISLIIFLFYMKNIEPFETDFKDEMIINGMVWFVVFYGLSLNFAPLFRIANYFKIFEIVFLIFYYDRIPKVNSKTMKSIIIAMFLSIYIGIALTDSVGLTNYQFRFLRIREDMNIIELKNDLSKAILNNNTN